MPVARTSQVWLAPSLAATAASTAYWRWVRAPASSASMA